MSVARITEISAESTQSFEDAIRTGISRANQTLRNGETGLVRTAVTNESGEYLFVSVPPGRYTVEAELAGFKKVERPDVSISVGTRQTLALTLEVGAVTETLVVSGGAPLVETTRSDLGGGYSFEFAGAIARGRALDDAASLDDISPPNVSFVARKDFSRRVYTQGRLAWYAEDERPGPSAGLQTLSL